MAGRLRADGPDTGDNARIHHDAGRDTHDARDVIASYDSRDVIDTRN
jgi:hypothetical protein